MPPADVIGDVQVRTRDREDARGPLEASRDRRGARLAQPVRGVDLGQLLPPAELVDARRDRGALDRREEGLEDGVGAGRTHGPPGRLVERRPRLDGRDLPELADEDLLIDLGLAELLEGHRREARGVGPAGAAVRIECLRVERAARRLERSSGLELRERAVVVAFGEAAVGELLARRGVEVAASRRAGCDERGGRLCVRRVFFEGRLEPRDRARLAIRAAEMIERDAAPARSAAPRGRRSWLRLRPSYRGPPRRFPIGRGSRSPRRSACRTPSLDRSMARATSSAWIADSASCSSACRMRAIATSSRTLWRDPCIASRRRRRSSRARCQSRAWVA